MRPPLTRTEDRRERETTPNEVAQLLKDGAILILGPGNIQHAAHAMRDGSGILVVPRDRAAELELPPVEMKWCLLMMRHRLPDTTHSADAARAWMSRTFGGIRIAGQPEIVCQHQEGSPYGSVVINWKRPIDATTCAAAAAEIESACLRAGGQV